MTNEQMLQSIQRRLQKLEREAVRLRRGEVTVNDPLSVALGGADTAYEDVAALDGPRLLDGDQVSALVAGNDMLVLGAINRLRIVHGEVSSVGAVAKGAGFTSARTGVGIYSVTFDPVFSAAPVVLLTALNAARVAGSPANILAGSFTATTWTSNTAALLDAAFSFIAIGPA